MLFEQRISNISELWTGHFQIELFKELSFTMFIDYNAVQLIYVPIRNVTLHNTASAQSLVNLTKIINS